MDTRVRETRIRGQRQHHSSDYTIANEGLRNMRKDYLDITL